MNFYPFHIGDYAVHTRHLSLMEDLAYRRLIDLYYTTEQPITLDVEKAAKLIGMREYIKEVSEVLSDYFLKSEDCYVNTRCDKEIEAYKAKADRARSANSSRWNAKKSDAVLKSDVKSDADRIPTNTNTNTNTNNQERALKPKAPAAPLPDWLQPAAWDDFKAHRKAIKAALTPRAETLAITELEKLRRDGHDPTEVIQQSIMRGWKGLFALNTQTQTKGQTRHEYLADKIADLTGRNKRPASNPEFIHGTAERVD